MLQRINPTINRKSTCNTSTKQCYPCLTAKIFQIQYFSQLKKHCCYKFSMAVKMLTSQSLQKALACHPITMQEHYNHGQLENYNIIIAALFYLIHTYLFNYFLSHHITQFSTFTVSCMCNSSLQCHMIFTLLLICNASINHHTNNNYGFTYMLLLYLIVIEDPLLNDFLLRDLIKLHLQGTS